MDERRDLGKMRAELDLAIQGVWDKWADRVSYDSLLTALLVVSMDRQMRFVDRLAPPSDPK
jgi:hypothetical protein